MPRKRPCPAPGTRKYGKKTRYSEDILTKALDDIKNCKMSQRVASETYGIPRSTLKYKLKNQHSKPVGKPPVLSSEEEKSISTYIISLADNGIPISMQDVRVIVNKYLDDNNKHVREFIDNFAGWEWGRLFLERHTNIKEKIAHAISRKRAQVSQEIIEQYFDNFSAEIEGIPPENIYNFDETGFHDNPKKEKLLFKRECRNPEVIRNSTKSCYTVMFCANAAGEFVPLYVIYKAKQKWSDWIKGAPSGTRMAVTPSGWIDAATFDDWFETQLLPFLKQKEGKKVVIGDNLSSHITTKCLRLCAENDIKFICLVPNSTHLLQPLDVSYFSALKTNWRKVLRDWRNTKRGKVINALPKGVFAALLTKTIQAGKETAAQNVIAGFKACGIYPLDREVVLKKLKDYAKPMDEVRNSIGETFKNYLTELRENDLQIKQHKKFQIPVVAGKSVSVEEVDKYYTERKEKEKIKQNKVQAKSKQQTAKKKGRPIGSKNKSKSKTVDKTGAGSSLVTELSSIRSLSPIPGPSNAEPMYCEDSAINNLPSPTVESLHNDLPIIDLAVSPPEQIYLPSPIEEIEVETSHEDIIGEYELNEGILTKIDDEKEEKENNEIKSGQFCIFKHEECLFPGRIVQQDEQTFKISVMQKAYEGWKWPANPEMVKSHKKYVVSYVKDGKIIKKGDSYMIDDPLLNMEWGD